MNIKIELEFICSLSHSLGRLPSKKNIRIVMVEDVEKLETLCTIGRNVQPL